VAQALKMPLDVKLMNWVANILFAGLACMALGALALWAARHPMWQLRGITVVGDVAHQNAVTFRAQLASRLQGSYLTLNLQEIQRLFESVPWVQQAVVQREFPNRLKVTLREHQAAAWWGEPGGGKLVNTQGVVFEANPDDPDADRLPELAGPVGQSQTVFALYQQLVPVLTRLDMGLERLELNSRGNWQIRLDNGAQIGMGRGEPDELLARLERWTSTHTQLAQRYGQHLESVDLRYPNGYAIRFKGVTTLDVPPGSKPNKS
jgi:cell division protein FtsQ